MTKFEVIGTVEPDSDHPSHYEALEEMNANLSGTFRVLMDNEQGESPSTTFYLAEETDE